MRSFTEYLNEAKSYEIRLGRSGFDLSWNDVDQDFDSGEGENTYTTTNIKKAKQELASVQDKFPEARLITIK